MPLILMIIVILIPTSANAQFGMMGYMQGSAANARASDLEERVLKLEKSIKALESYCGKQSDDQ